MSTTPTVATDVLPGVVAFTDVVGFTEFTAIQGDDEAVRLLELHEQLLACVLPDGARIVKNLGDGFLLWFLDVCGAVDALVGFQDRLDAVEDDAWPLAVRIGAHFGRPRSRGDDLLGHDVNVAARILDVAGPGEVLVSEPLVEMLRSAGRDIDVVELGPVSMRGLPEPVRLYRVPRDVAVPGAPA